MVCLPKVREKERERERERARARERESASERERLLQISRCSFHKKLFHYKWFTYYPPPPPPPAPDLTPSNSFKRSYDVKDTVCKTHN